MMAGELLGAQMLLCKFALVSIGRSARPTK